MGAAAAVLVLALAADASAAVAVRDGTGVPPTAEDLKGAWAGTATHDGETTPFSLELEPGADGKITIRATVPTAHLDRQPIGSTSLEVHGNEVRLGPFTFSYDGTAGTLTGVVPEGFAPVYHLALVLHHVNRIESPPRPEPSGPVARPVWTYEAGAALWAGPTFAEGVVYAGGEDGQLHALDANTGQKRWCSRAVGPIRTRPAVADGAVYFQADDGFLYKLSTASGEQLWRVRVTDQPIERLPFDNPKSRFDRFGSDVTVSAGRLYLGTHGGRVLALDAGRGTQLWQFATGDSVLAAPAVDSGRVYAGSFDKLVYALDAATGRLLWKHDTHGAIVSTPAVAQNRVVVGNRTYDLLALDAGSGEVAWKRYVWFSWIESSATIRDGIAYVGSSDAAGVYAFDVASGRRVWEASVYGWAWGQPAVTAARVYMGTSSQVGYPAAHRAGVMALDRATGRPAWRYEAEAAKAGAFGFPGSPAVGAGLVFVTGLDGRVYAFTQ